MLALIKVVGNFCNLHCRYCYYYKNDQSKRTIMEYDLLEKFIAEYLKLFSGKINFIWHGGEPLLAGIPFFKKAVELQKNYARGNHIVKNSIQTNAVLINDDWAQFFKNNDFKVSISIDGNKESHNRFRKDKNGDDTFDKVIKGIKILQKYKVKLVFMQTIIFSNIKNLKDDFLFLVDSLGVQSWGFCPYSVLDKNQIAMPQEHIDNVTMTEYLKECISLWLLKDDPKLRIREIDNYITGVIGKSSNCCAFNGSCTSYLCLNYDGKIYPCFKFSGQDEFLFGDFSKTSLFEILNGAKCREYTKDVNTIHSDCSSCEWKSFCYNGCSALRVNSIKGKFYYCEIRKNLFNYLENIVEECQKKILIKGTTMIGKEAIRGAIKRITTASEQEAVI